MNLDLLRALVPEEAECPSGGVGEPPDNAPSLCPAFAELERAFQAFGELAFKRQMPLPVFTIQTRGRKNAKGWFWQDKWQNGQPRKLREINICAEFLGGDIEDIAEVLLHEMCHYANYLDGIKDCSSSQYHNRKFKRRCDLIGLVCEKSKRGWAHTRLSPELREIVRKVNLNPDAFKMYRTGSQYRLVAAAPERRFLRWICECQPRPQIIYGSKKTRAACPVCFKEFKHKQQ